MLDYISTKIAEELYQLWRLIKRYIIPVIRKQASQLVQSIKKLKPIKKDIIVEETSQQQQPSEVIDVVPRSYTPVITQTVFNLGYHIEKAIQQGRIGSVIRYVLSESYGNGEQVAEIKRILAKHGIYEQNYSQYINMQ